jgi:hypothetical protein
VLRVSRVRTFTLLHFYLPFTIQGYSVVSPSVSIPVTERAELFFSHAILQHIGSHLRRIIKNTSEAGLILCHDETVGSRARKYLPIMYVRGYTGSQGAVVLCADWTPYRTSLVR